MTGKLRKNHARLQLIARLVRFVAKPEESIRYPSDPLLAALRG